MGKLILAMSRELIHAHPQLISTLERAYSVQLYMESRVPEAKFEEFWHSKRLDALVLDGSLVKPTQLVGLPPRDFPLVLINPPFVMPDKFVREPLCAIYDCTGGYLDLRMWGNGEKYVDLLCMILAGICSRVSFALDSYSFTEKEKEVLVMLLQGLKDDHIARALFISPKTVRNHVSNMLRKVRVDSRTQLVLWAMQREARK